MLRRSARTLVCFLLACATSICHVTLAVAQTPPAAPSRADVLRGGYGPYQTNNDPVS